MRKQPKQERSRQLVASLVDATGKAITQRGLAAVTTNHVAELAGVSQGSLYQYFESLDDLLEALLERMSDDVTRLFGEVVTQSDSADSYDWILRAIRVGATTLHGNGGLNMELVRNWHLLPTRGLADKLQRRMLEVVQGYFLRNGLGRPIPDFPERLFICFNSVLFTLIRLYSEDKPTVREEVVIKGLASMVNELLADALTKPGGRKR